jgi:hypothetical protein
MTVDIANAQMIEGLRVYGDSEVGNRFYVVPSEPSYWIDPVTKKTSFFFMKYKLPVDRPDGKKGGGVLIFDCQFAVPDDKLKTIQRALDDQVKKLRDWSGKPFTAAQISDLPITSATATVNVVSANGLFVEKVFAPASPSLFPPMICPISVELTQEGATMVEDSMKAGGISIVTVVYDIHFPATFPPITGDIWFDASKYYSFYQKIDKSGGSWDSSDNTENDTLREQFRSSNCGDVWFDFGNIGILADTDPELAKKTETDITNWGWGQVDEAAKSLTLPDIKPADDRGDHGMEHITKSQSTLETASFRRHLSQREGIVFKAPIEGHLPSIVALGVKWEDVSRDIDLNDPFFATIMASFNINADFERFGISSVDVHCQYTKTNPATVKDFHFTKPDDMGKFDSDTANADMHYVYSFAVNYKDQSLPYQSQPVTTDKGQVTINANDLGVLVAQFSIGNVDFTKTPQVQVNVTYPDTDANGQPINQQFNFDTTKKSDQLLAVILKPVDKRFTYQTTYIMTDGTQVVFDPKESQTDHVFINSPFTQHTYSFLAEADFANTIDNIFLRMKYTDPANKVENDSDYQFKAGQTQRDWAIPIVANSKGQINYSGVISYKDHTTENIPETTTTSDLITFGPPNQVIISITPDTSLIDFTQVKLVKLELEYKDAANKIDQKHEFVLKQGMAPPTWTIFARDPNVTSYTYSATFYIAGTPPKTVAIPPTTTSDNGLVLMMPS